MNILILSRDYESALRKLYSTQPDLKYQTYNHQVQQRDKTYFGVTQNYSFYLRQLGHKVHDVKVNNRHAQFAWAKENGVPVWRMLTIGTSPFIAPRKYLPFRSSWFAPILAEQVRAFKPDIILNLAMDGVETSTLMEIRGRAKLVGQLAAPIPKGASYKGYDLFFSSLPNFVDDFQKMGIRSRYLPLGFDPRILSELSPTTDRDIPVSFVGNLSKDHSARTQWMSKIAQKIDVKIWGGSLPDLPPNSPVNSAYQGEAWGLEMYKILSRSKITLNFHIDVAAMCANNLRLYEATGMGAMLITDDRKNMSDLFACGKEVICYRDTDDCIERIRYFLQHDEERSIIASQGQARTFRDHTIGNRMERMLDELSSLFQ